ncbi:MAG: YcjX family protein [Candidatus Competibacterales bacterium]
MRIVITGLERSGKTIMITSLVHQLLNQGRFYHFPRDHQAYPVKAELLPLPNQRPRFPYEDHIDCLTGEHPTWPAKTTEASEIHLQLKYRRTQETSAGLWEPVGPYRELKLELVDYPGEWIVDLPLMTQDYGAWSAETLRQSHRPPRDALAKPWHAALAEIDVHASPAQDTLAPLVDSYQAFLQACRVRGLVDAQPGFYFLKPQNLEHGAWEFTPLPATAVDTPLYRAFAERYGAYQQLLQEFYQSYFAKAQVQIVLVDVFRILKLGIDAFNDHRRLLSRIVKSHRYYQPWWGEDVLGWLYRQVRPPAIERTILAATKAELAEDLDQGSAKYLDEYARQLGLEREVEGNAAAAVLFTTHIAAVDCRELVRSRKDEKDVRVRATVARDNALERRIYPADKAIVSLSPEGFPGYREQWPDDVEIPTLMPPRFPDRAGYALEHLNLDRLLGLALQEYL